MTKTTARSFRLFPRQSSKIRAIQSKSVVRHRKNLNIEHLESRALLAADIAPMVEFSNTDVEIPGGSSALTRTDNMISVQAMTANLTPGDAVTLWWAVFNNPEFCVKECDVSDLSIPEVQAAVLYADGDVVGEDGKVTFSASLAEGDVSGVNPEHAGLPGAGIGMADASKATVHIVMRDHGAAFPEGDSRRDEQLSLFNGGCNPQCTNVQAALFDSPDAVVANDPVHPFSDPTIDIAETDAKLTRYADKIAVRADTAELVPGNAVTLWWAVFNNPEFCVKECDVADLSIPEVQAAVLYADGEVVGEDGKVTFSASLAEGDVSGVNPEHAGLAGAGIGMADASKATVHIVMRDHGAAFPEGDSRRDEQLSLFNGGCNPQCTNVQAALFDSPDAVVTNDPVHPFSDPTIDIAETDAKLTRYADKIAVRADTAELVPGDAVTLWWAVFNNPEFCVKECDVADLSIPEVQAAVLYADGEVVGEDGKVTFSASLAEGDVSGVNPEHAGLPGAGIGMADASKATVHIVMRDHGAAFPEGDSRRDEQLSLFNGGCNTQCTNVQAALFDSPNPIILGDSNHDGIFNSADLVLVFQAGKYEDGIPDNATFEEGDWDGNGDFDTSDLVTAFKPGQYVQAAVPAARAVAPAATDRSAAIDALFAQNSGDANDDGVFDSRDLTVIFQAGEYEDGIPGNSMWSEGDWNGDGEFDTSDLILAFQQGKYQSALAAQSAVKTNTDGNNHPRPLADKTLPTAARFSPHRHTIGR
jgi:chitodextrinase